MYDVQSKKLVDPKNLNRRFKLLEEAKKIVQAHRLFKYISLNDKYAIIQIKVDQDACYIITAKASQVGYHDYVDFDFRSASQINIFFDTEIIRKRKNMNWVGHLYDLSLSESVDFTENNQILGDLPQLIAAKDIRKEIQLSLYSNFKTNISWSDCLNKTGKIDVLRSKWKSLKYLHGKVNVNKYDIYEVSMLRQLQQKLTEAEFIKVVNFYSSHQNISFFTRLQYDAANISMWFRVRTKEQWTAIYMAYVLNRLNLLSKIDKRTYVNTITDYCYNYLEIHPRQLQMTYRSWNKFSKEEVVIAYDAVALKYSKKLGSKAYNEVLNQQTEWDKLRKNVNKTDLSLTMVDTGKKLFYEGCTQHNCVGTYYEKIRNNESCILHYEKPNKNGRIDKYTVEVVNKGTKEKPHYKVIQIFKTYNESPEEGVTERLETILNQNK